MIDLSDLSGLDTGLFSDYNKRAVLILGLAFISLVIVAVLVVIFGSCDGPSMAKTQNYCEQNHLEIETEKDDKTGKSELICRDEADATEIRFAVYDRPVMETKDYAQNYQDALESWEVLEENEGCKKIYTTNGTGVKYRIIEDKIYIDITMSSDEMARKALIELGFPDRSWAH